MTITPTAHPEVLLIEPNKFEDKRGWFMESFRKINWKKQLAITHIFARKTKPNQLWSDQRPALPNASHMPSPNLLPSFKVKF